MQPLSKPLSRGPEVKAMLRGFRVNFTVVVQGSLWEIHQSTNRGRRGSLSTLSSSMSHVPSISCHLHLFFMHFLPPPTTTIPHTLHYTPWHLQRQSYATESTRHLVYHPVWPSHSLAPCLVWTSHSLAPCLVRSVRAEGDGWPVWLEESDTHML